jgi:hypothetical protein
VPYLSGNVVLKNCTFICRKLEEHIIAGENIGSSGEVTSITYDANDLDGILRYPVPALSGLLRNL